MLRIHQSSSVAAAKSYYVSGLETEGYYSKEGDEGRWFGKAAERLGLTGVVQQKDFHRLCENVRPDTGARLNPRKDKDRKVGYDFTFSAPKSVSILFEVLNDRRILEMFKSAVRETMALIEENAQVRVRKKGVVATRNTGNLVFAEFIHHTTRPVILPGQDASTVDPALHCHCYVMNTSFDSAEGIFKAAELVGTKRDAPYFEAVFHSKLSGGLARLGYGIEPKALGFEIKGVGEKNIRSFSQRTAEIEQLAMQLGISSNAKAKAQLGALSRKRKELRASKAEILRDWRRRVDRSELCYHQQHPGNPGMTAELATDLAIAGAFERRSVVPYRRLVAEALRASLGAADLVTVEGECASRGELVSGEMNGAIHCTTHAVLREEEGILEFLRVTQGTAMQLNPWHLGGWNLDSDQCLAIQAMLQSTDRVFVVEGKAGSGKTSMMRSAVAAIEEAGTNVFTFAPTSQAAHEVLRSEGFAGSETIQQLLANSRLQDEITFGDVLWIDEAGLLSTREMLRLFKIAEQRGARLILSGDRYQHHSVERGDAFRLVAESGLVEVRQTRSIYRQRNDQHREAVRQISTGDVAEGFAILEEMGAIRQADTLPEQISSVATDYVQSCRLHKTVLVVSPTHFEGRLVTTEIRRMLIEEGKISGSGVPIVVHRSRNLTVAERCQSRFVSCGDVVRFHQNAKGGFKRGEIWLVHQTGEGGVLLKSLDGNRSAELPFEAARHCQIYALDHIEVAVGDKVRLLANTATIDGSKLFNGSVHEITGIDRRGNVILDRRLHLPGDCGLLDHGYVVTSQSSQGRTVDKVIISQSATSVGASSREQFYVSVSRSRDAISIWTDDKAQLLESIQRSDERLLGRELNSGFEYAREGEEIEAAQVLDEPVEELQQTI